MTNERIVYAYTALWEFECCGEPMEIGQLRTVDHVPWEHDLPAPVPGSPDSPLVTQWYVGHHTTADEPGAERHRVRVEGLWEEYRHLTYVPGEGYFPTPGTSRLEPVRSMATFRPEWREDQLEPPADHTPSEPGGWVLRLKVLDD